MSDQWYVARNNKKHGPFTAAKLKELAAQGRLLSTDMLLKEGMQKWAAASSVKGLFTPGTARPADVEKPQTPNGGSDFQFDDTGSAKAKRCPSSLAIGLMIFGAGGGGVLLLTLLVVLLVVVFRGRTPTGNAGDDRAAQKGAPTDKGGSEGSPTLSSGEKGGVKTITDIHPKSVNCVAFSPDGKLLATASRSDGTIKLWHLLSGDPFLTISVGKDGFDDIAFSPDGRIIACACTHTFSMWDVGTGNRLFSQPNNDSFQGVAFNPDGKRVVNYGYKQRIQIWDTATGQPLLKTPPLGGGVYRIAFTQDGKLLATCQYNKVVLWDADTVTNQHLIIAPHQNENFCDLALSRDGRRIATVQRVRKARAESAALSVWDTKSGKELFTVPAHSYPPGSVRYSPNGKLILTATAKSSYDSSNPVFEAAVWDAASGNRISTFTKHFGCIRSVAIHPDNRHVATASTDGTVKVWEAATGNELLVLRSNEFRTAPPASKQDTDTNDTPFDHAANTKAALKKKIIEISYANAVQPVTKTYEAMCKPQRFKAVIGNPDQGDTSEGRNKLWTYSCSDGEITFRVHVLGNSAIQVVKIER
jgi:WD40 repeat protein